MLLNGRKCDGVEGRWRWWRGEIRCCWRRDWDRTITLIVACDGRNWRSLLQIDLIVVDDQIGHFLAYVTQLFIIVRLAQIQRSLFAGMLASLLGRTQRIALVGLKCWEYWIHLCNDTLDGFSIDFSSLSLVIVYGLLSDFYWLTKWLRRWLLYFQLPNCVCWSAAYVDFFLIVNWLSRSLCWHNLHSCNLC